MPARGEPSAGRWTEPWKPNCPWQPCAWLWHDEPCRQAWSTTPIGACSTPRPDYTALLQDHGIQISMSRKGNPWDNAACESFMKTLKYEEVYRIEYRDLTHARSRIREFLETIYNRKRLHSALGYLPPAEFERGLLEKQNVEAAGGDFLYEFSEA